MAKLNIYKYVRRGKGWRYCKAAFHPRERQDQTQHRGRQRCRGKTHQGEVFLNFNNRWIDVGLDALEALRKRLLRLNQMEYGSSANALRQSRAFR